LFIIAGSLHLLAFGIILLTSGNLRPLATEFNTGALVEL
jgi:hypothetical protein